MAASIDSAVAHGGSNWFALYATSKHEKRVSEFLQLQQVEYYLPLYKTVRRWNNGCKVQLELPLFPNYLFVRISPQERSAVLQIPGVISLVGSGRKATVLPDGEIDALRSGLAQHKFEPHAYLTVGQKVRIKSGPMQGMTGILVRKKNETRIVLNLDLIMKSVAVEIDGADVDPVA
jgi:transcription antitermination factor NusG